MKKILIASNNQGKLKTAKFVFANSDFELFTPSCLNINIDVDETGTTYEENALLKAEAFSKLALDYIVFADDSGINVDALPGQLGIHSRRFGAGPNATDQEWLDFFLDTIKHVTDPKERTASMQTTACLITPSGPKFFTAKLSGFIAQQQLSPIQKGVPFSSVFIIPEINKCIADLDFETKSNYSHRINAYKQMLDYLKSNHA